MLPLIGAYQVANALVAAGLVIATGGDIGQTLGNLARLQPVRGRLERAAITQGGRAGLCRLCAYTRRDRGRDRRRCARTPKGRLILVFGAGGDRDRASAPMGQGGRGKGRCVIVTDDNPRGEDPSADPCRGAEGRAGGEIIGDRRAAIAAAIAEAGRATSSASRARGMSRARSSAIACHSVRRCAVAREEAA
jgi:UDP-N-acetylmuramoyl-L-alanyl-D-glutamate--2,6-diaminopimelate ligase